MLFSHTRPIIAGYFQCDLTTQRPPTDRSRQAALLYVTSGQGEWSVGSWKFPVRRGDMFALPLGISANADLTPNRPLGYFYCYFELDENAPVSLNWPWELGVGASTENAAQLVPCASGAFRPEIAAYYRALQYELGRSNPASVAAARAQLTLLGVNFARMLALTAKKGAADHRRGPRLSKPLPEPVACVVDYVLAHLDKDMTLGELAAIARCSERRFVDIFRQAVGISPMAYVRERRVFEAQRLLNQGLAVKDVANRLNFADSHHFSRVFRECTGVSPSEYAAGKAPVRQRASGEFAVASNRASIAAGE